MHAPTRLSWLTRPRDQGTTWGVPWPRGTVATDTPFALRVGADASAPIATAVQSWVTATWPDGSVKWSAHAVGSQDWPDPVLTLVPGEIPSAPQQPVRVSQDDHEVVVDTGVVQWTIPRRGPQLASSVTAGERPVAGRVTMISLWQGAPDGDDHRPTREQLVGHVEEVEVEQTGPVRAVVTLRGHHDSPDASSGAATSGSAARAGRGGWLAYTVRLVFSAGAAEVKIIHSVVLDGDPEQDFLAGLGLRAEVPLTDELHDRHVRLAGPDRSDGRPGFLTEAVRGITGLRRDPGAAYRSAQVAGRACGPVAEWAPEVGTRTHLIPAWSDWTLDQTSSDGFTLAKRTVSDRPWVTIPAGTRSAGYGYLGGVSGGVALGLRDFWKLHPTRLDVRDASSGTGSITVWLWSPSAPAMDLRFYHDGLGQDTYAEQLEGLEITYEDYEPGFGNAHGIARTHELVLRGCEATPTGVELAAQAAALSDPALLVASPEHLRAAGVLGDWSLPDRGRPEAAAIEDRLDWLVDYYRDQVEQRRWYGFFDYGDVMHSYDPDRHQWKYDIGGFAWDNSELSPDLWLWTQFLRTGRPELFRLAEAMTRHTSEVDVYHTGRWQGLGTRHNVQHWGCSAKQLRISTPAYRRIFYYLTADERVGELLDDLATSEQTFGLLDPNRKVRTDAYIPDPHAVAIGLGTDYGALLATWLTRWERHGDLAARDKLIGTMSDVGALPHGFLTGEALLDLDTGRFDRSRDRISVSHLSAVFGLTELCSELITLTHGTEWEQPGFEQAWLQYCRLFMSPPEQQRAELGQVLTGISLPQAHSRLTAWAAHYSRDAELARRAWGEFVHDRGDQLNHNAMQLQDRWDSQLVDDASVLAPVTEATMISTNGAAQYGLAAIQNLALVGGPTARVMIGSFVVCHGSARRRVSGWCHGCLDEPLTPRRTSMASDHHDDPPQIRHTVIDTIDARRAAEFYRELLGLDYRPRDRPPTDGSADDADWLVLVDGAGRSVLAFQQTEVVHRSTWPDPAVPMQLHLDLTVPDREALERQHDRALALGAQVLFDRTDDPDEPLYVIADLDGHPVCIFVG